MGVRRIAVIGLGRFGMHLARQLGAASQAQVIAIDRSAPLVDKIKDEVEVAVRLDSTDRAALSGAIQEIDVGVVSIGEHFEAALLTTVILRQLAVPRIICRAQTELHAEIFRQVGAHEVIQPESQAGETLARKLANPQLQDFISLAEGYTLIEMATPAAFTGRSLRDLALRNRYDVNLVAVKQTVTREQEDGTVVHDVTASVPRADYVITTGDILVLVGSNDALNRLPKE
ncbi:MAG: TrkA family potassium uptake protein [Planctomycetaceae bacterium]|nr:TrkA family potassium uptake protein [Planctomycetaceae bacterium]